MVCASDCERWQNSEREMKPGNVVKELHPMDGTPFAGTPIGGALVITRIADHCPVDGCHRKDSIAFLSNGRWAFVWNLQIVGTRR